MSVRKDKDGRWHVEFKQRSKRIHRRCPKNATKSDALALEARLRQQIADHKPDNPDPSMMRVMDFFIEYSKTLRSPKTAYYNAARIQPWLEKYRASQARECAAHIIADLKRHYRPASINRSLWTLQRALKLAWERGAIPENHGAKIKKLPENNKREIYLTVEQVRYLATFASPDTQAAIWIALLTGARRGEILKMRPEHIGASSINIPSDNTKTLSGRNVPIVSALRPWLAHLPLSIGVEGIKSGFRRARERAGMPEVHFHDLRHSCASILIGLGVDLFTISKILGHASITTTQRYAHLEIERQKEALEKLSAVIGQ